MGINNHFPVTVIDNFFDNPSEVVRRAYKLKYFDGDRRYPGTRTANLAEAYPALHYLLCTKVFSPWYKNTLLDGKFNCNVKSFFQKTEMYDPDPLSIINTGWPHIDEVAMGAGVVYLTPNANPNSGTSMFLPKSHYLDFQEECRSTSDLKNTFYNNPGEIDKEEYIRRKVEFCSNFDLTVEIKNVFNRCIIYSGNQFHAESCFQGSAEEQRLTLVFFIENVNATETPLMRVTRDIIM